MTRVAFVVHEEKVAAEAGDPRPLLFAAIGAAGWPPAEVFTTSEDDPGRYGTERALASGAELVVVCGGDGTVSSCAAALAGTGVPMAVLPSGTGNLIASNLGIPADPAAAVDTAISGTDRAIDVGRCAEGVVVGMAGLGLDAAMVADAPQRLKKTVGWPAYGVSLIRHLTDPGFHVVLELDGSYRRAHRHVRTVVLGNVGALHGGLTLLPGAKPDDGLFDIAVVAPRGIGGWLSILARMLRPNSASRPRAIRHYRARRVVVTGNRPVQREIDGETVLPGRVLEVVVDPGSLLVRLPRQEGQS